MAQNVANAQANLTACHEGLTPTRSSAETLAMANKNPQHSFTGVFLL